MHFRCRPAPPGAGRPDARPMVRLRCVSCRRHARPDSRCRPVSGIPKRPVRRPWEAPSRRRHGRTTGQGPETRNAAHGRPCAALSARRGSVPADRPRGPRGGAPRAGCGRDLSENDASRRALWRELRPAFRLPALRTLMARLSASRQGRIPGGCAAESGGNAVPRRQSDFPITAIGYGYRLLPGDGLSASLPDLRLLPGGAAVRRSRPREDAGAGSPVLLSPPLLTSGPRPETKMPIGATFMPRGYWAGRRQSAGEPETPPRPGCHRAGMAKAHRRLRPAPHRPDVGERKPGLDSRLALRRMIHARPHRRRSPVWRGEPAPHSIVSIRRRPQGYAGRG